MQDIVCWHRWQWEAKRHLGAWRQVRLAPVFHLVLNGNQTSARRHILRQTRHSLFLFLVFRSFFMLFSKAAQLTEMWNSYCNCLVLSCIAVNNCKTCKEKLILIQREPQQGGSSHPPQMVERHFYSGNMNLKVLKQCSPTVPKQQSFEAKRWAFSFVFDIIVISLSAWCH